jgi:hypothetical protein
MTAATLSATVDIAAVEEHLARYAVSCPLCKAVGRMGVAQRMCGFDAHAIEDTVPVVLVVCKRCGYLIPLAADRLSRPSALSGLSGLP